MLYTKANKWCDVMWCEMMLLVCTLRAVSIKCSPQLEYGITFTPMRYYWKGGIFLQGDPIFLNNAFTFSYVKQMVFPH